MNMMHGGVIALVHAVILLAVSFFVLLAAHKTESRNLKVFGYCVAVLIWGCAALVLGTGVSERNSMCHKGQMMGERFDRPMGPAGAQQTPNRALPR